MRKTLLGQTGLKVSSACLGTMTFGEQNDQQSSHAQLDMALDHGINFIDTAEMYPVPPKAETCGRTEEILGHWTKMRTKRCDFILATKAIGYGHQFPYIRGGRSAPDAKNLKLALENSLRRLQTDYIDLYQIHWPDRETNYFGQLGFTVPASKHAHVSILETLEALGCLVKEGKVRSIGVSNETPWGVSKYLEYSNNKSLPRIASIQNPYSLLNRSFEAGLAEFSHREQVSLLAYSPLAMGMLTGKYLKRPWPPESRFARFNRFTRYLSEQSFRATECYRKLADQNGLTLTELALGYLNSKPFMTSMILGATTLEQLRENIRASQTQLNAALLTKIDDIHRIYTYPSP